jgi:hypothetical protein
MPNKVLLKKAVALVVSLARLHNFCIDQKQLQIENMIAWDERYIERLGAVPLEEDARTNGQRIPRQLIGGGHHFVGMERNERCCLDRSFSGIELPRERLLAIVIDQDFR